MNITAVLLLAPPCVRAAPNPGLRLLSRVVSRSFVVAAATGGAATSFLRGSTPSNASQNPPKAAKCCGNPVLSRLAKQASLGPGLAGHDSCGKKVFRKRIPSRALTATLDTATTVRCSRLRQPLVESFSAMCLQWPSRRHAAGYAD